MQTTTRNASLTDLRDLLLNQHARKVDIIAPASKIRSVGGVIVVEGADPVIDDSGVTSADGEYTPTDIFDEGVSGKLNIPLAYVRRMRADRPDLYDANVNGWLHGVEGEDADKRSFMLRCFRGDDGPGIARAFLSDRYSVMDNLDALTAALDGVRQAGVDVEIEGADLTDRRMYVRIVSPEVQALAPVLLERYRSPFTGATGAHNPTVFAGFVISNSETGGGAFTIVPRLVVQVCKNGMTIQKDALRNVHLGGRMEEGVIRWAEDTETKNLALVTARARDAVRTFLDTDYMTTVIRRIEEKSGKPIDNAEDVKIVTKRLQFDQETSDAVFNMFVKGGDATAGGVMQAVTAAARATDDADKAHEMEAQALKALDLAAAL